jgi:tellurite methyltransferase
MTAEDRVRWDRIYRADEQRPYPAPDPLLFESVPLPSSESARALDFAGGVGQNGLWLAERGYAVDIVDVSRVALNRARSEMASRNLRRVNLLPLDVDTLVVDPSLPHEGYDIVVVFRYLKREMFPVLAAAVKPGGRLVYETFNRRYLEIVPAFNVDFLLGDGELPAAFPGWQVLHHAEDDHRTQFVAVKPISNQNETEES